MSRVSWPAVPGSERSALRRRWWQLAAFTAAVVLSEVLIGLLKGIYDRPRPPGSLVITTGRQRAA